MNVRFDSPRNGAPSSGFIIVGALEKEKKPWLLNSDRNERVELPNLHMYGFFCSFLIFCACPRRIYFVACVTHSGQTFAWRWITCFSSAVANHELIPSCEMCGGARPAGMAGGNGGAAGGNRVRFFSLFSSSLNGNWD